MRTQSGQEPHGEQKQWGQIEQNLETLLSMHVAENEALTRSQKAIERLVSTISAPIFLFGTIAACGAWIAANLVRLAMRQQPWDAPPFGLLQTIVSLLSLIVMMLVAITQHRQAKVAAHNVRLDQQVNLLIDKKASKIIELLEELRVDSPDLKDRFDQEAKDLQQTIDPEGLSERITDKLATTLGDEGQNLPA